MLSLGPGGDLRPAGDRQLRPRRAVHDRRLRGLGRAGVFGISFWLALLLAPLVVGALGVVIERTLLKRLYKHRPDLRPAADLRPGADRRGHLPRPVRRLGPAVPGARAAAGRHQPRLHGAAQLPRLRRLRLAAGLPGDLVADRAHAAGRYLRAGTENPALVQAFGINVPMMVMLTYAAGAGPGRARRRAGRAGDPDHAADGQQPDHRRLRGGGDRRHGLDPGLHPHRPGARAVEGLTKVFYPEASSIVVFVIMAIVLMIRPAGPVRQGEVMSAVPHPLVAPRPLGLAGRPARCCWPRRSSACTRSS